MKIKLMLTILSLSAAFVLFQDSNDAKAPSINGVTTFIMSEPVNDYDIVEDFNTALKIRSVGRLDKHVQMFVDQAIKERRKGTDFDALYLDGTHRGYLIKFK